MLQSGCGRTEAAVVVAHIITRESARMICPDVMHLGGCPNKKNFWHEANAVVRNTSSLLSDFLHMDMGIVADRV